MGRVRALDGFRAISIVIVVLSHAQASPGFPAGLRPFLVAGAAGVQVFFVLSGYLITSLLLVEQAATGTISLRNFYIRRFFRIVPALALLIACIALYDSYRGWRIPGVVYVNALTFTTGILPLPPGGALLQHTWSLSVEEQFYVIWPLFFARAARRTRYVATAAILVLWPMVRVAMYAMKLSRFFAQSSLGWADAIMWGCAAAMVSREAPQRISRLLAYRPSLCRLFAVFLFFAMAKLSTAGKLGILTVPLGSTLMSAAVAYLILSYVNDDRDWAGRLLTNRVVVGLGVLSYSLYLWQEPFTVNGALGPVFIWNSFPVNVIVAVAFALLSYYAVERPLMRFRRRFLNETRVVRPAQAAR